MFYINGYEFTFPYCVVIAYKFEKTFGKIVFKLLSSVHSCQKSKLQILISRSEGVNSIVYIFTSIKGNTKVMAATVN